MVNPFTLSPSSTFLSPTKTLKRFSALTHSKRQPRSLSVTVTSLHKPGPDIDSSHLPPNVQTFWQWLRDEGVVSAKAPARPALVQEGLGLVAQRDLTRNEVVLEVPKRLWINPDAVAASDIGSVCSDLKPWVSVALFLIREKLKSDSPWRYYLDVLPEYTNSTIYWWVWLTFGCLSFLCSNSVVSMDLKLWG
jgi:[ribulose-bisphosphate carboxylase]-lysine N-methyltransferase